MKTHLKKAIDEVIGWGVPILCAGILVAWKDIPAGIQHYAPVAAVAVLGLCCMLLALQNRRELIRLRGTLEKACEKDKETRARDDMIAKAFRAMLDDDMGKLYAICAARGYTAEDERRRYNRLQNAYEAVGGNGEARRRKEHFDALPDEEEWRGRRKN